MKIFLPIIAFGRAGGFRVLSQLANHWKKENYDVVFLCCMIDGIKPKPYFPTTAEIIYIDRRGDAIKNEDDPVLLPYEKSESFLKRVFQMNALRKAIDKYTDSSSIVLATYALTAFSVQMSKSPGRKFYYIQAYEPEYFGKDLKGLISAWIIKWTYNLHLTRIVNSPIYYKYRNLTAYHCVYPGLDFSIYNITGKKYKNFSSEPLIIGTIGRREKFKGTVFVLDAYKELKERGVNCELCVAAFGIDELLRQYEGVQSVVPKNDNELVEYYKNVDVLIDPGFIQFGAVHYPVIEAMACGTPVMTTCFHPAHPDNAWIVAPQSSHSIAVQIENMIKNPDVVKEKAKRANQDINHLDWKIIAGNMISVFDKA